MKVSINTDLTFKGETYHVQTEDWGLEHRKIVTRVYSHGQVKKTFETKYDSIEKLSRLESDVLKKQAQLQHQKVIDWVFEN